MRPAARARLSVAFARTSGRVAASSPGAGACDLEFGLQVWKGELEARLLRKLARDVRAGSRLRRGPAPSGAEETDESRVALSAPSPDTDQVPIPPGGGRLARIGRYVGVAVTALTGAILNTSPFLPLIDLPYAAVAAIVVGFETIVILACKGLGAASVERERRTAAEKLTIHALAVTVLALAAIRAHQLVEETDLPSVLVLPAAAFFAAIGSLLCALSYDLGRTGVADAWARRSARSATRSSKKGRRTRRTGHVSMARDDSRRLRREAGRRLANSCLAAYYQGYRAAAPAELQPEIDDVKVPEVNVS